MTYIKAPLEGGMGQETAISLHNMRLLPPGLKIHSVNFTVIHLL